MVAERRNPTGSGADPGQHDHRELRLCRQRPILGSDVAQVGMEVGIESGLQVGNRWENYECSQRLPDYRDERLEVTQRVCQRSKCILLGASVARELPRPLASLFPRSLLLAGLKLRAGLKLPAGLEFCAWLELRAWLDLREVTADACPESWTERERPRTLTI